MKKKLLFILTVLIVVLMGLTIVACNDYTSPEEEDVTEDTVTRSQLVSNGTFYKATGSTSDSYVKTTVTDWTASKGSLGTATEGVTHGVIDLTNQKSFNLNKDMFYVGDDTVLWEKKKSDDNIEPKIDPATPKELDEEGEETEDLQDTNVLFISSELTAGSLYYKTGSITLSAGKYYRLQYSVCTAIDMTDVPEADQSKKGARVNVTGAVEYVEDCINTNGEWETHYLYIEANKLATSTISIRLWLGNGPEKVNGVENVYSTRGTVFFDNIILTEVTSVSDPAYNDGAEVSLDPEEIDTAHANFALLSANSESDFGYVSTYYLADLGLTQLLESSNFPNSSVANVTKYAYSFREGNYQNDNTKNYTMVVGKSGLAAADQPSVTNAFTGIVDLAKLYDADQKNTYDELLGTSIVFNAPSYDDWANKIMNGNRGDLNDLDETKALMIYHNDLSAVGFTNSSDIVIEKDKNYIITVYAYVWAQYDAEKGEIVYPSANAPKDPGDLTNTQKIYKKYFDEETDEGGLFYGYFVELTEEETGKIANKPTPETKESAINTLVASADYKTAMTTAGYDEDVYSTFQYKYLYEHFDEYVTAGTLKEGDETYVEYRYLTERKNFLEKTWKGITDQEEKMATYTSEYADYILKYDLWSDNNDRPYAKVKLTGAGDDIVKTTQYWNKGIASDNGWEEITFYVTGNQLGNRNLKLEFWFGEGSATEYENLMFGGVFFDNINIVEVSDEVKNSAAYADKDWETLSPITDKSELEFGGLIKNEEISDHWDLALADNVAAEDREKIEFGYTDYLVNGEALVVTVDEEDVALQELVLHHTEATASIVTGKDILTIKKNTAYRLAIWAYDEIEGGEVTIELIGGKTANVDEMSTLSSVSSFNSKDWKELAFYILGDSQVENYAALRITVGSGTRFSTEKYVKGEIHLAVINYSEIKYSEYKATNKSGDEVKSYAFSNTSTASDSVTNGSFSSIDLDSTSAEVFAEDGALDQDSVAKLQNWTQGTTKNNTFNTIKVSTKKLEDAEYDHKYKLYWDAVVGVDANGEDTYPDAYEVYAKFNENGEVVERLYAIVDKDHIDGDEKVYCEVVLDGKTATSFRVRAVSDKAVSSYSDSVTPASATADGAAFITEDQVEGKKEIKAGAVSNGIVRAADGTIVKEEDGSVPEANKGLFAGSDYVSPYNTALLISSNYLASVTMTAADKSLSANSYYYISVWVMTQDGAKASVTVGNVSKVLTAKRDENYIGFVNIDTEGKWVQYGFYVKTGMTSSNFGLQLSLGNPSAVKVNKKSEKVTTSVAVYDEADLSSGKVYFDAVKVLTVTESEYEEALNGEGKGEDTLVGFDYLYPNNKKIYRNLVYTTDSFDAITENSTSEGTDGYNLGDTPNNYTYAKASDASGSSEKQRVYGVYNYAKDSDSKIAQINTISDEEAGTDEDAFAGLLPDGFEFDVRRFIRIDGYNSLVMSNKEPFGQSYTTSSTVTIGANAYYKITFKAKALVGKEVTDENGQKTISTDGVNGEFRFEQNGSATEYQSIYINTTKADDIYAAQEYTLYIYNPSATSSTAKWAFFFGDNVDKEDTTGSKQLLIGVMVVDQVSIDKITEEDYTAAKEAYDALTDEQKTGSVAKVYSYPEDKKDSSDEDNKDDEGDDTDTTSNTTSIWDRGDAWLLISSIVIAVVIVIVVVVVIIRRWKKKHPREVVVENNYNADKEIKKSEPKDVPAPVVNEPIDEDTEEYTDVVEKPIYIQRVVRKDKNKGKKK